MKPNAKVPKRGAEISISKQEEWEMEKEQEGETEQVEESGREGKKANCGSGREKAEEAAGESA